MGVKFCGSERTFSFFFGSDTTTAVVVVLSFVEHPYAIIISILAVAPFIIFIFMIMLQCF